MWKNYEAIEIFSEVVLQNLVREEVDVKSFLDKAHDVLNFQVWIVWDVGNLESKCLASIVERVCNKLELTSCIPGSLVIKIM